MSLGAGPLLCVLGWFFDRGPSLEHVIAVDVLPWSGVRGLRSHGDLLDEVIGSASLEYMDGIFIPHVLTPQCGVVDGRLRPLNLQVIPEGATVLLPMLLNHLLGANGPMSVADLTPWFRELEQRAGRIVAIDLDSEAKDTGDFWAAVKELFGLRGAPPVVRFVEASTRFEPCYPETTYARVPESRRRTGLMAPQFCKVTGCVFDHERGWRWLERSRRR